MEGCAEDIRVQTVLQRDCKTFPWLWLLWPEISELQLRDWKYSEIFFQWLSNFRDLCSFFVRDISVTYFSVTDKFSETGTRKKTVTKKLVTTKSVTANFLWLTILGTDKKWVTENFPRLTSQKRYMCFSWCSLLHVPQYLFLSALVPQCGVLSALSSVQLFAVHWVCKDLYWTFRNNSRPKN